MFLHRLLVPSTIVAAIALIVALGGVAFTATQLPKNSVGPAQLRSNAVTRSKVASKAVTESKLASNAVTSSKVKDRSLRSADIDLAGLGKVPAAAIADRATEAGHASDADRAKSTDQVDGQHVERVAASIPPGTTSMVVGSDGGLVLAAECDQAGELTLVARSTAAHALARASIISAFTPPATVSVAEDADLNPGEDLVLFDAHGRGTAQVVYQGADGRVTTAVVGFGELTGSQTCTVAGTLVRAG